MIAAYLCFDGPNATPTASQRSRVPFGRIVKELQLGAFLLKPARVTRDSGPALHRFLLDDPEWSLVYAQPDAMVFLQNSRENADAFREIESLQQNRSPQ